MALETATEGGKRTTRHGAGHFSEPRIWCVLSSLAVFGERGARRLRGRRRQQHTTRRAMLVADPFAGIPFWRVLALALAVPAVQAILTGINLNWLAVLVSPLHALCFLCILTIQAREQG